MPGFCKCPLAANCRCGEEPHDIDWIWEPKSQLANESIFSEDFREVTFHRSYSLGTAVIRGNMEMVNDHHYYWEIKILTKLYGTDVMIGVGTENINYGEITQQYLSFLGLNAESYGFSYKGTIQHDGIHTHYSPGFNQGDIVGIYLDMWNGTLELFLNRKSIGIAYRGLKKHKKLYPILCSTSYSAIRLIYSMSCPASLVFNSARSLGQLPYANNILNNVPGYSNFFKNAFWILLPTLNKDEELIDDETEDCYCDKIVKKTHSRQTLFFNAKRDSCGNCKKMSTSDTLKRDINPSDSKDGPIYFDSEELWLTALAPTTENKNVIIFSSNKHDTKCQNCNTSMATVLNKSTQSKKCVDCFYRV